MASLRTALRSNAHAGAIIRRPASWRDAYICDTAGAGRLGMRRKFALAARVTGRHIPAWNT